MRKSLSIVTFVLAAAAATAAIAEAYPEKPIRLIVPVPPGGTPDVTARLIAPGLAAALKQQVVVDNRPGAGSLIGAELAAKSLPDGYTLLFSSGGPLTILPHIQKSMPFDALRDFAPISLISSGPFVLVTNPAAPFKSIKEFHAAAKAAPGRFNYASAGNGSPNHLATELFKIMAGIDITHVPYKGAPQGVTDVMANQIDLNFSSIAPLLGHIRANRLRPLAISGAKRAGLLPDVPTAAESIAPGFEFTSWFGLVTPAKTPQPIIELLSDALAKAAQSPQLRRQFESNGAELIASSPSAFAAHIRREYERNGKTVKTANIRID